MDSVVPKPLHSRFSWVGLGLGKPVSFDSSIFLAPREIAPIPWPLALAKVAALMPVFLASFRRLISSVMAAKTLSTRRHLRQAPTARLRHSL